MNQLELMIDLEYFITFTSPIHDECADINRFRKLGNISCGSIYGLRQLLESAARLHGICSAGLPS